MNIFRVFSTAKGPQDEKCCGTCIHFQDDPAVLEERFAGIGALSSVRGDSRGDAGICTRHGRYLLPVHTCPEFTPKP